MPLKMCKQGLAKRVRCKSHRWGRRCFVWSIIGAQQSLCSRRLRCELVAKTHDARVIVVRICYTAPDEQKRRRSFCSTPRGRIERRRSSRGLRGCTARRCDRAFQRWKIAGAKQGSLSLLSSWGFRRYYCCFPRFLFPFPIILLLLRNRSFALIIVLPLPTVGDVSSHLR
jgi:hypothetical protein